MGSNNFTNQAEGEVANASDVQQVIDALKSDQVPRNTAGVAEADSGSIGTEALPFLKANISSGYFFCGMIIPMHTFNGTISPSQGWFPCDGSEINQTNYDAIHGVGSWAKYVGASPIDGKFSPDMTNKYLMGVAATTQDGTAALTSVGNTGNQFDNRHNHKWYDAEGTSALSATTYASAGNLVSIVSIAKTGNGIAFTAGTDVGEPSIQSGTTGDELYTDNQGSATQDVRPESIEVKYYIRVI